MRQLFLLRGFTFCVVLCCHSSLLAFEAPSVPEDKEWFNRVYLFGGDFILGEFQEVACEACDEARERPVTGEEQATDNVVYDVEIIEECFDGNCTDEGTVQILFQHHHEADRLDLTGKRVLTFVSRSSCADRTDCFFPSTPYVAEPFNLLVELDGYPSGEPRHSI